MQMIIEVKIIPKSSKMELLQLSEKSFKIKLTEPPEKGKANQQCIEILAKHFNVRKQDVIIIHGATSRHKKVLINDISNKS